MGTATITIAAEEIEASANVEMVKFNPRANLADDNLCFFIMYRQITLGKYTPIYKSEIKRKQPANREFQWN